MSALFIQHPVKDFKKWKSVYDTLDNFRKDNGVTKQAVFQSSEDPNQVLVLHEFRSLDSLRAFTIQDVLKDAMIEAGVSGSPTFSVAE